MEQNLHWYTIYGSILCSQVEYPHLISTQKRSADIYLELSPLERKTDDPKGCFVDQITKERIYFCNQVGSFLITNGNRIQIWPNDGVSLNQLTPFVFGYSIAMLFWQQNKVAVHCSAIEYRNKAIIIAGNSGSGKSTLTARLLKNDFHLMTDDVAILSKTDCDILVHPAFPQQKLCRDMLERNHINLEELLYIDEDRDKYAISRKDTFCNQITPLAGMFFLSVNNDGKLLCSELTGTDKLTVFLENLFLFPMFRNSNVFSPEEMLRCISIVKAIPMYRISRPNNVDSTVAQTDFIMNAIFTEGEEL